jgi:hypothetical protein
MTTYQQAQDIMFGIFKSAWDTTGLNAYYQEVREAIPQNENSWASVFLGGIDSRQSALSNHVGSRKFTRESTMLVQIFVHHGKGLQTVNNLVKILTDAFEGISTPGVFVRNTEVSSSKRDGSFIQTNLTINFSYDEIK